MDKMGNILAKKSDNGYMLFPGGGIDRNEYMEEGVKRETFEETGAIIKNLKKVGELKFIWGSHWAKNEKQRKRYQRYKGEDMHFFMGEIDRFEEPLKKEEDFWEGKKLMPIFEVIDAINAQKPFQRKNKKYREIQLKFLKELQKAKQ